MDKNEVAVRELIENWQKQFVKEISMSYCLFIPMTSSCTMFPTSMN